MDYSDYGSILSVRYVKLHFSLRIMEDCSLPFYKASAIRGGLGEMLLRANCIRSRKCDGCDFYKECIVQRTMYSQYEIQPDFVTEGDSIGYVLECEDYREQFQKGDILRFQLILFGKTIVYFSQYLQALYSLGLQGLGKEQARFQIAGVTNTKQEPILDNGSIYMEHYEIQTIADYVKYRLELICKDGLPGQLQMYFYTPLSQKYQGEFLSDFRMDAILRSIQRRVFLLDCFEGIKGADQYRQSLPAPVIDRQDPVFTKVMRYSSRQDRKMPLRGIRGEILLSEIPEITLPYLAAGELIHIGKNTSFGFGRYMLHQPVCSTAPLT